MNALCLSRERSAELRTSFDENLGIDFATFALAKYYRGKVKLVEPDEYWLVCIHKAQALCLVRVVDARENSVQLTFDSDHGSGPCVWYKIEDLDFVEKIEE